MFERKCSVTVKNKLGIIKSIEINEEKNGNMLQDLLGLLNKNTCFDLFKDCKLDLTGDEKVPLIHLV